MKEEKKYTQQYRHARMLYRGSPHLCGLSSHHDKFCFFFFLHFGWNYFNFNLSNVDLEKIQSELHYSVKSLIMLSLHFSIIFQLFYDWNILKKTLDVFIQMLCIKGLSYDFEHFRILNLIRKQAIICSKSNSIHLLN